MVFNDVEMVDKPKRGALIILEGCDKSGKSTQCRLLVEKLNKSKIPAHLMSFPDRTTPIGLLINDYLKKDVQISDEAIHLLFAANRWERAKEMQSLISRGVTVIVDRYSFSGVAYSTAKKMKHRSLQWFKNPEEGLPKPDSVIFLNLEPEVIARRKGFGNERYELPQFQQDVAECYKQLHDTTWKVVDADKTVEDLVSDLYEIVKNVIESCSGEPLGAMW